MSDLPICACGEFYQAHHPECPARRAFEEALSRLDEVSKELAATKGGPVSCEEHGWVGDDDCVYCKADAAEARAITAESRLDAETKRADNAEMASGAAYQAVGSLASDFDIFDHPLMQKLMTVLSRQEEHEDLLPWPSKHPERWRLEARNAPENVEHVQFVGDLGPFCAVCGEKLSE